MAGWLLSHPKSWPRYHQQSRDLQESFHNDQGEHDGERLGATIWPKMKVDISGRHLVAKYHMTFTFSVEKLEVTAAPTPISQTSVDITRALASKFIR